MEALEVNMYVRTKYGITQYKEYETSKGKLLCMPLMNGTFANIEDVLNASYDILDLIQPMDVLFVDIDNGYAGGIIVPRIPETINEVNKIKEKIKKGELILKGIVPKEVLIDNCYEVE